MKKLSIVLIAGLISVNAFASMDFYTASEPRQITKASDVVVLTGVDAENLYQIIPGPEHPSLRAEIAKIDKSFAKLSDEVGKTLVLRKDKDGFVADSIHCLKSSQEALTCVMQTSHRE